eukprot:5037696-Amphidinium_carterae.1
MDSILESSEECDLGVHTHEIDSVHMTCNMRTKRHAHRSQSTDEVQYRYAGAEKMRRTRQKDRPSSSGRSRSA